MSKKKIKEMLLEYIQSLEVNDTIFFEEGKENISKLSEDENVVGISINERKIPLFKFSSNEELEEIYSWEVLDNIIIKSDTIKCLILNKNQIVEKNCSINNQENIGYKVIIDVSDILENWELFLANVSKLLDIKKIKDDPDKFYFEKCEKLIREMDIGVLEINNLNVIEETLKQKILDAPLDFIRTNLVIINKDYNSLLTLYDFNIDVEKEKKVNLGNVVFCKYPFYLELISFLESAQNLKHNHLKYIDYYHVLEYFITDYAYRKLEDSIKNFVSLYLEGGSYEGFRRALMKISEDNQMVNLSKDEPLIDVIKQIDIKEILNIINSNKLYCELKQDIFGIEDTRLINKWAKTDRNAIIKVEVEDNDKEEFYKKLQKRIYKIRNVLIHSQAKFRGKESIDFLPTKEYEEKLKEDVILIRELAIKLCKIECVN